MIGGSKKFLTWAADKFGIQDSNTYYTYELAAEANYQALINSDERRFCYFDLRIGSNDVKRLVFELDYASCRRTCENFISIIQGGQLSPEGTRLCYKDSKIHRVVKNGYLEGGFVKSRKGGVNESVFGGFFTDENYIVQHNKIGILGMSKARPHENGSVFYITLNELPHMNQQYVAFGRVIEGIEVLRQINELECKYQRPATDLTIEDCGLLTEITISRIETPQEVDDKEEEKRPVSKEKHEMKKSKLENADIDTLLKKRDAVIKDIEKTKAELESQQFCLKVIREIIERKEG